MKHNRKSTSIKILLLIVDCIVALIPTVMLVIIYEMMVGENVDLLEAILVFGLTLTSILLIKRKKINRRACIYASITGGAYSILYVYGTLIQFKFGSYRCFQDFLFSVLLMLGYSVFSILLFLVILIYLPELRKYNLIKYRKEKLITNKKRVYWFYFMIIVVSFIPMFLAYYPVLLQYDGGDQMRQVVLNSFTKWHPLAHTILLDIFYSLGLLMDNVQMGMAFYSLFQMLILALVFAYSIYILYRNGISKIIRGIILGFFILFPVNAIFAITTTKDVLYAGLFLAFIVQLTNITIFHRKITYVNFIFTAVTGCLTLMYRNNAIYAFIVALPFVLICISKIRWKVVGIFVGAIIGCVCLNNILFVGMNATDTSNITEMLSVPLMQMVKATNENEATIDKEIKRKIYSIIPKDKFSQSGLISDDVKSSADNGWIANNPIEFIKLWGSIGINYPMEYVDAAALLTMGYWYMNDDYHAMIYGKYMLLGHKEIGVGVEIEKTVYFPAYREIIDGIFGENQYLKIPILSFFCQPAIYFWILVGYIMIVIYEKRWKFLVPSILGMAYMGTLFLGPTALVRYMYCIIVMVPFLIGLLLLNNEEDETCLGNKEIDEII